MTREELVNELTPVVQKLFQNPELVIVDDMSADNVSTWTSLSFMQLLSVIEEKYGFRFKMMELLKLKNMGAVLEATLAHINA